MRSQRKCAGFWREFSSVAVEIKGMLGKDLRAAFDAVQSLMEKHGFDECFDLTEDADCAVLILTPEGDSSIACEIDLLLAARPEVPGWRFHGRRQAKPLSDAIAIVRNLFGVDVSNARVGTKRTDAHQLVITLHESCFGHLSPAVGDALVLTLLDHAMGEEWVMSNHVRGACKDSASASYDLASWVVRNRSVPIVD